jgi:cell division protein FtsZ
VVDITGAYGVLIYIMDGDDVTLGEVMQAGELMFQKAPNTGRIVWGAKVDETIAGHVKVAAVLTGVSDPKNIK